jgi:cytochrome c
MKMIWILAIVVIIYSCKNKEAQQHQYNSPPDNSTLTPEAYGEIIFNTKGNCATCHNIDQKIVGPSIQEIAKIYNTENASIVKFLKGEAKPIVDPSQYSIMETNLSITKRMQDEELLAIEAYINSCLK